MNYLDYFTYNQFTLFNRLYTIDIILSKVHAEIQCFFKKCGNFGTVFIQININFFKQIALKRPIISIPSCTNSICAILSNSVYVAMLRITIGKYNI